MPLTFKVFFHPRSTHWVQVVVHSTRRAMRCQLTKLGHDSSHTDAACWQANKPGKDNLVAEIHLALDNLNLSNIVHECSHAAYHRAVLLGLRKDDNRFEEWVADDTGVIADALIAFLDLKRVSIRYESVPKRRLI